MSIPPPTPAPIPAFAAVESPLEELSLGALVDVESDGRDEGDGLADVGPGLDVDEVEAATTF